MKTSILLCSMGRPTLLAQNIRRLYETTQGHEIELVVVIDRDAESVRAVSALCLELNVPYTLQFNPTPRGAITCWNEALRLSTGDLLFPSGDDQEFEGGWLDHAKAAHAGLGGYGCVGINDNLNSSASFCTTLFFDRKFCKEVYGGVIAPTILKYYCVDNLLDELARKAGKFAYCPESVVRHIHPSAGRRPADDTDLSHGDYWTEDVEMMERWRSRGRNIEWEGVI